MDVDLTFSKLNRLSPNPKHEEPKAVNISRCRPLLLGPCDIVV